MSQSRFSNAIFHCGKWLPDFVLYADIRRYRLSVFRQSVLDADPFASPFQRGVLLLQPLVLRQERGAGGVVASVNSSST